MQKVANALCPQSQLSNKKKLLKRRSEFLGSYKGSQIRKEHFVLYFIPNKKGSNRVGVTVPKATGTAVVRNKWKRWVKEEFRNFKAEDLSLDFHFFVKSKFKSKEDYKEVKFATVKKEINDAIKQVIKISK